MEIVKIGNNIKKLRELKNYTQEYMASQLEMSQGGYGKIERGETDISLSKIDAIAKILGVNVSVILDFDDKIFFNINQNSNEQVETLAGVIFENKPFESEKAHYEAQLEQQKEFITQLKEEIAHLRDEVVFLRKIITKTQD